MTKVAHPTEKPVGHTDVLALTYLSISKQQPTRTSLTIHPLSVPYFVFQEFCFVVYNYVVCSLDSVLVYLQ